MWTKKELLQKIRTALGGRAAEIVYYGGEDGLSTGASGDLRHASRIAEAMLCEYGMDEESSLYVGHSKEPLAEEKREKINLLLQRELEQSVASISENRDKINRLVELLLRKNKLTAAEIEACLL